MSTKRFRIALSFAGERRAFVSQVATILAERFGQSAILYDKFHEAEFARRDLGIQLPNLYYDESELIVVVMCPKYDEKQWTGLEWTAIHALMSERGNEGVMLCRFEHAEVDGLFSTSGYVELDDLTPAQAADRVLERLARNEGKEKDHYIHPASAGARPLSTSIPNNLPRLQPFFGREAELAAIREALDPESRTWGVLIDGPGGMGKTSLAVRAAYDCEPGQFERIIFLSVKDREMDDDGVRHLTGVILPGWLEMLNELARELGQPDIAKTPEDQRVRLLLDALRPMQALLILDNLESLAKGERDQLFTFVKRLPQGCKAILTSRRRIGSGSELLILEKLDEAAALETLAELARHNPLLAKTTEAQRITLYRETGGTPLLLRWVAGQLGRGSCRTLTGALEFLRSCPPENDPLEFVFGDLAKEFTAEETSVLAVLTYFSLPAEMEHIVELTEMSTPSVETALRALSNRSLVVPDQEETSFSLLPMVAEFLRRKRPEIVQKMGEILLSRAYHYATEDGYHKHERFPVLEAAWPMVAAALPVLLAGPSGTLQAVCSALDGFLNFTGRWDEQLSLAEQAEFRAVEASDYLSASRRAYDAGWLYFIRFEAASVLECADRALSHLEAAGAGAAERSEAFQLRGLGHTLNADHAAAIAAFRERLERAREAEPVSANFSIALHDLADCYRVSGDLDTAEQYFREALAMARKVDFTEGIAGFQSNWAQLELDRKNWHKAEELAREALPLVESLGRQELIAYNHLHLADALAQQAKLAEARIHARRAVDVFRRIGHAQLEVALRTLQICESPAQVE